MRVMVRYRVSTDNGATRDVIFATALVADEQFPQSVLEKADIELPGSARDLIQAWDASSPILSPDNTGVSGMSGLSGASRMSGTSGLTTINVFWKLRLGRTSSTSQGRETRGRTTS